MMKSISCLLLLSVCLYAVAEDCWDKDFIEKEYAAHEKECKEKFKSEDKIEFKACIFGRYDCITNGKVDYDKTEAVIKSKITNSATKRDAVIAGLKICKEKNINLDDHPFWHCIGDVITKECMSS